MKLLIGIFMIMGFSLPVESDAHFHNDSEWHVEVKQEEAGGRKEHT